ncbi:helix-turn-helix domain-containing protein [bacterium]|nr:helix-turn-helix domain-containing protein [bacterium]
MRSFATQSVNPCNGRRIRAEILSRGMTVKELAERLGYSPRYLHGVINGAQPARRCSRARRAIEDFFGLHFWPQTTPTQP